jgi:hypothetical protein
MISLLRFKSGASFAFDAVTLAYSAFRRCDHEHTLSIWGRWSLGRMVTGPACSVRCWWSSELDVAAMDLNRQHFLEQYLDIPVWNKELLLRRRAMRQLIGKIPIKYRNVTEEIYFSEDVRCQHCQSMVPMGIEVVSVRKEGQSKKVIKHCWYCRAHGAEFVTRAQ